MTVTDPRTGKVTQNVWRVRPPVVQPKQQAKPVYTVESVQRDLAELKQALSSAEAEYEGKADTTVHDRMIEIGKRLDVLMPEVTALQNELTELRARPSVDQAFIAHVSTLEFDTQEGAERRVEALVELKSQRPFGCPAKEPSHESNRDILAGLKPFRDHTVKYNVRFGQAGNKTVTAARERIAQSLTRVDAITNLLLTKAN
jgi:hypothetical protein